MYNHHHEHSHSCCNNPHSDNGHMSHIIDFEKKFWISLILAIPILLMSPVMGTNLPFQLSFIGSNWVVMIISTILYFYGGMPFLSGAKEEIKARNPAMMTLITLGISAAYFYSLYAFIMNLLIAEQSHMMDFFWELATLIVIMLLGHWIEMKAVAKAGNALQKMAELLPSKANLQQADGSFVEIPLKELKIGQTVMVKSGEKVPADGLVVEGETTVNESLLTGEARDVIKKAGDKLIGGSQNKTGNILIKVTGTGELGYLAQVMNMVQNAMSEKSRAETISDKVAKWLFYASVMVGIITFIIWLMISDDVGTAITRMVTVLVIACPHALGLAIPLVVARSTSLGAQNGLLVRNRKSLESAYKVNMIMMDKTGTLTEGHFKLAEVLSFDNKFSIDDVLSTMAALEAASSHPLAISIINEAKSRNLKLQKTSQLKNIAGIGVSGVLADGSEGKIVNISYLEKNKISYDKNIYRNLANSGYSISVLLVNDIVAGLVAQGDKLREEAVELIKSLKLKNIIPLMLTGDNKPAAQTIASLLDLDNYEAELLPDDKEKIIKAYQDKLFTVMMVGDGINDAPALARADIGVAIGAGTDIAIDSADIVLVKSNPMDILYFLSLAKNTTNKMIQNLWWGAGYNIFAIPLAAGILAPVGIVLTPAVGAILMSLSTIIVAVNAMMLKIK